MLYNMLYSMQYNMVWICIWAFCQRWIGRRLDCSLPASVLFKTATEEGDLEVIDLKEDGDDNQDVRLFKWPVFTCYITCYITSQERVNCYITY